MKTDLSKFDNSWYHVGASPVKRFFWYYTNLIFFTSKWWPFNSIRTSLLKLFGARIGKGVIIKPGVNIKYPWKLSIGDHSWIGEDVWIDNLDEVKIGSHVCVSQGALLLCGNHNYKKESFDLVIGPITLEDGVWIGAKSTVTSNVTCGTHAVLSVGSVASKDLNPYTVFAGIPAQVIRKREITDS